MQNPHLPPGSLGNLERQFTEESHANDITARCNLPLGCWPSDPRQLQSQTELRLQAGGVHGACSSPYGLVSAHHSSSGVSAHIPKTPAPFLPYWQNELLSSPATNSFLIHGAQNFGCRPTRFDLDYSAVGRKDQGYCEDSSRPMSWFQNPNIIWPCTVQFSNLKDSRNLGDRPTHYDTDHSAVKRSEDLGYAENSSRPLSLFQNPIIPRQLPTQCSNSRESTGSQSFQNSLKPSSGHRSLCADNINAARPMSQVQNPSIQMQLLTQFSNSRESTGSSSFVNSSKPPIGRGSLCTDDVIARPMSEFQNPSIQSQCTEQCSSPKESAGSLSFINNSKPSSGNRSLSTYNVNALISSRYISDKNVNEVTKTAVCPKEFESHGLRIAQQSALLEPHPTTAFDNQFRMLANKPRPSLGMNSERENMHSVISSTCSFTLNDRQLCEEPFQKAIGKFTPVVTSSVISESETKSGESPSTKRRFSVPEANETPSDDHSVSSDNVVFPEGQPQPLTCHQASNVYAHVANPISEVLPNHSVESPVKEKSEVLVEKIRELISTWKPPLTVPERETNYSDGEGSADQVRPLQASSSGIQALKDSVTDVVSTPGEQNEPVLMLARNSHSSKAEESCKPMRTEDHLIVLEKELSRSAVEKSMTVSKANLICRDAMCINPSCKENSVGSSRVVATTVRQDEQIGKPESTGNLEVPKAATRELFSSVEQCSSVAIESKFSNSEKSTCYTGTVPIHISFIAKPSAKENRVYCNVVSAPKAQSEHVLNPDRNLKPFKVKAELLSEVEQSNRSNVTRSAINSNSVPSSTSIFTDANSHANTCSGTLQKDNSLEESPTMKARLQASELQPCKEKSSVIRSVIKACSGLCKSEEMPSNEHVDASENRLSRSSSTVCNDCDQSEEAQLDFTEKSISSDCTVGALCSIEERWAEDHQKDLGSVLTAVDYNENSCSSVHTIASLSSTEERWTENHQKDPGSVSTELYYDENSCSSVRTVASSSTEEMWAENHQKDQRSVSTELDYNENCYSSVHIVASSSSIEERRTENQNDLGSASTSSDERPLQLVDFRSWHYWLKSTLSFKASKIQNQLLEEFHLKHFYKCMSYNCLFSSDNVENFICHSQIEHISETLHCCYCFHRFTHARQLAQHMVTSHGRRMYQCSRCLYRASTKTHLVYHKTSCHSVPFFKCKQPACIPHRKNELQLKEMKEYCCAIVGCCLRTMDVNVFQNHFYRKHNNAASYPCGYCKFVTPRVSLLLTHYQKHDVYKLECVYCEYGCGEEKKILDHLSIVHPDNKIAVYTRHHDLMDKSFPRDVCVPEFTANYAKNFCCGDKTCSFELWNMGHYRTHLSSVHHHLEGCLPCPHCPKQYDTLDDLEEHVYMHGPNLYGCSNCSYVHWRARMLQQHFLQQHGVAKCEVIVVRESANRYRPIASLPTNLQGNVALDSPLDKQYRYTIDSGSEREFTDGPESLVGDSEDSLDSVGEYKGRNSGNGSSGESEIDGTSTEKEIPVESDDKTSTVVISHTLPVSNKHPARRGRPKMYTIPEFYQQNESSSRNRNSKKQQYICSCCDQVEASETDLLVHYRRKHKYTRAVSCSFCSEFLLSEEVRDVHLKLHHSKGRTSWRQTGQGLRSEVGRSLWCFSCSYNTTNAHHMREHLCCELDYNPFYCSICDFQSKRQSLVNRHGEEKHGNSQVSVDRQESNVENWLRSYLAVAYTRVGLKQRIRNGSYICIVCEESIPYAYRYRIHLYNHLQYRPYACRMCDEKFPSATEVGNHVKEQHNGLLGNNFTSFCISRVEEWVDRMVQSKRKRKESEDTESVENSEKRLRTYDSPDNILEEIAEEESTTCGGDNDMPDEGLNDVAEKTEKVSQLLGLSSIYIYTPKQCPVNSKVYMQDVFKYMNFDPKVKVEKCVQAATALKDGFVRVQV